ncbi:MAG: 6-phosphogluconolactonase [Nitriliruptoraceae bacterium]
MRLEVLETPDALAERGADLLAELLRDALAARGRATLAVSGGQTPGATLAALARRDVDWEHVHVLQVDERIAPDGHPERNLGLLRRSFLGQLAGPTPSLHAMPVTAGDAEVAAARYAGLLVALAGAPPVLDVVQLGLGSDGHTASLVPDDPVLDVEDREVAVTQPYQGRRRLTCTFPLLARARQRVWLVSGAAKASAVARVQAGDRRLPAARLPQRDSHWLLDRAAATALDRSAVPASTTALPDPTTAATREEQRP